MTYQETLVALCSPLLTGGLHDHVAPQGTPTPYGVYAEVAGAGENTLSDGIGINRALIQLDVYDQTYAGADAVGRALESVLEAAFQAGTLTGARQGRRSVYDPDLKLRRIIYEYSIWYR